MIFTRYFLSRFFINIFSINIGLTLLLNLIEFFEKMVRVKQTSIETILFFIALNIIPSFFENMPLSCWLGSCLTIKEMHQQNEWNVVQLLNIGTKRIFALILIAGTTLMIFNFFGKEIVTQHITKKAEQFKQEKFKQSAHEKIFNRWFALNKAFCHINYLDLKRKVGTQFSMLELSPNFKIKKVTSAQMFSISPETKEIIISEGTMLSTDAKKQRALYDEKLHLPSLFSQLKIQGQALSLKQIFHVVIFDYKVLPKYVYHQLLYLFLSRFLIHLLLLLYPLLTFAFFLLFPYHRYYRWILIFVPYPLVVFLSTTSDAFMSLFQNGMFAVGPYVILIFLSIGAYLAIRK